MSLEGKKITKEQSEIIEGLIKCFQGIEKEIEEYGEDDVDLQDDKDAILGLAKELVNSFQ